MAAPEDIGSVHEDSFPTEKPGFSTTAHLDIKYGQTKRGLSPRHVQLMAIGGSIGTGLFVGIGSVLSRSGPLSLFLGYLLWGVFFVWPCNLCVAEMCAYLPVRGTIFELAARFVDPAVGFAMGWTYFYAGVMLVCVEYSSIATVMQYWNKDINPAVWIAMAMVVCIFLNVVAVKYVDSLHRVRSTYGRYLTDWIIGGTEKQSLSWPLSSYYSSSA